MKYLECILACVLISNLAYGQETKKPEDIKALVDSRRFEFVAQSANPLRGRTIFLSPGYTFTVLPDTVESNLPYYGRAYQASIDPDDAGIKFTSTDFDYVTKERKKSGWHIDIKTKDARNSPRADISVSENGTASLRVISLDKQAISFSGFIRKPGDK